MKDLQSLPFFYRGAADATHDIGDPLTPLWSWNSRRLPPGWQRFGTRHAPRRARSVACEICLKQRHSRLTPNIYAAALAAGSPRSQSTNADLGCRRFRSPAIGDRSANTQVFNCWISFSNLCSTIYRFTARTARAKREMQPNRKCEYEDPQRQSTARTRHLWPRRGA